MGCAQSNVETETIVEYYAQQGCDLYFIDSMRARRRPYLCDLARFSADAPQKHRAAVIDRLERMIVERQRRARPRKFAKSNRLRNTF